MGAERASATRRHRREEPHGAAWLPIHRALPDAPHHASVLSLQRTAGNRAVAQALSTGAPMIQRNWFTDAVGAVGDTATRGANWVEDRAGDALDARGDEAMRDFQEDRQELEDYKAEGVRGPENMRAPTGIGGFGGAYDPRLQQLMIRLAGGVNFVDSIQFFGPLAIVSHPNPTATLTSFVAQLNRMPAADRAAAAAPYVWAGGDKTAFTSTFNAGVASRWSAKHEFHTTKTNWTDLGATVDVQSALHDGPKGDEEHVSLTVYKTPPAGAGNVGVVNSRSGGMFSSNADDATNNSMTLNSADATPRADNLLQFSGSFPSGTNALDAGGTTRLNQIGATYRGGGPGCRICGVTILASSGGPTLTVKIQGADEPTARARYRHILDALGAGGNLDIAARAEFNYAGVGDDYTVMAGGGVAQTVAEHEAGHMFGLGDEYATGEGSMISGTGAAAGAPAKHDELVKDMGLEGAVHENNDGIMSLGSIVQPQHYATFHWALGELTGLDWALGPPVRVLPPGTSGPGDFPVPTAGDSAMA